ncbi:MAG: hypothetical protein WKF81_14040 [Thermomicrobiales bacterium]
MIVRRYSAISGALRPFLLCTVLVTAFIVPRSALADTDLTIGSTAVVAYANGDNVRLRSDFSYEAETIGFVAESSTVTTIDGPFEAADGSL